MSESVQQQDDVDSESDDSWNETAIETLIIQQPSPPTITYNTRSRKHESLNMRHRQNHHQEQRQDQLRRSLRLQQDRDNSNSGDNAVGATSANKRRKRIRRERDVDDDDEDETSIAPIKACSYCKSQIPADATRCRYCQATLEIVEQMTGEGFIVVKRRRADESAGGSVYETVTVRIVDDSLRRRLQRIMGYDVALLQSSGSAGGSDGELTLAQLFAVREELRADPQAHERTFLADLLRFLDRETRHLAEAYDEMRRHGLVSFTMLPHAFPVGSFVYGWQQRRLVGMRVSSLEIVSSALSSSVVVRGDVLYYDGTRLQTLTHRIIVQQFDGLAALDSLPVRAMTNAVRRELEARAVRLRTHVLDTKSSSQSRFVEYRGMMLRRGASRAQNAGESLAEADSRQDATGRAMIDGAAMRRIQPNYPFLEAAFYRDESDFDPTAAEDAEETDDSSNSDEQRDKGSAGASVLSDNDPLLCCTWPTVCGFSFRLKKWGEFYVDSIDPVRWNGDSFAQLVLPDEHRRLVSALVTHVADEALHRQHHQQQQQSDIVSNKGRGCVVLLHGPPGTGKTATAETIAEHLRLPLYVVSAGELGVTADQVQKRLRSILDLCASWRSIVLIDEADAFLARRSSGDVARNALVCVFLRMLEYHSGILFLTTNRMRDFDEAFFSRVHLALPYAPLDADARARVWRTMLAMTGMRYDEQQIDLPRLAALQLNGRQIRTVVRLATMLAKYDLINGTANSRRSHDTFCADDFVLPLRHLQQFEHDQQQRQNDHHTDDCLEIENVYS